MINTNYNFRPSVGIVQPDGTQTITYLDNKSIVRTTVSTPDKIEKFINKTNARDRKGQKIINRWMYIPVEIGAFAGLIACKSDDSLRMLSSGVSGAACGFFVGLCGAIIHANKLAKKYSKEYVEDIKSLAITKDNSTAENKIFNA